MEKGKLIVEEFVEAQVKTWKTRISKDGKKVISLRRIQNG